MREEKHRSVQDQFTWRSFKATPALIQYSTFNPAAPQVKVAKQIYTKVWVSNNIFRERISMMCSWNCDIFWQAVLFPICQRICLSNYLEICVFFSFFMSPSFCILNTWFFLADDIVIILQLIINFILFSKSFIFCSHTNSFLKASFSVNLCLLKLFGS